jgi:anti-sigma regulatory factor (Ser/Thr protein kinase)
MEHRLRNDLGELRQLGAWVSAFAETHGIPGSVAHAIDLALEEWLTNVVSYAYADQAEHWITVRLECSAGEARMTVEDDGREFDPLDRPPVDTTEPLETRGIGGLGIHMIRKLMDRVEYRRAGGRNILTMTKCVAG